MTSWVLPKAMLGMIYAVRQAKRAGSAQRFRPVRGRASSLQCCDPSLRINTIKCAREMLADALRDRAHYDFASRKERAMSNDDKTVELITNLDRASVEGILQQVVIEAKARGLEDIVTLLGDFVGMSRADMQKRIALCLEF